MLAAERWPLDVMERIVLKHLSGSKANEVEEFPLKHFTELLIGRDPGATVKYHPEQDDLVGRQHARITRDESNPNQFLLTDLDSRNGTFLNKHRVYGTSRISPGDTVQFGPAGPEFEFQVEPPPAAPETRIADEAGRPSTAPPMPPPTRAVSSGPPVVSPPPSQPPPSQPSGPPRQTVGKATVERMIAHSTTETKKSSAGIALAVVALLVVGVGAYLYLGGWETISGSIAEDRFGPGETTIASQNSEAVVLVEVSWKLFDIDTGRQLYHWYVNNPVYRQYDRFPGVASRQIVPLYIRFPDNRIEPALFTGDQAGRNYPVGARGSGSGFVASPEGFILTSRHIAASWEENFTAWPPQAAPGLVAVLGRRGTDYVWVGWEELVTAPADWMPSRTRFKASQVINLTQIRVPETSGPTRSVEGRHDYLDVTFAKTSLRIPATLTRVSQRHDVAMINIAAPSALPTVNFPTDAAEVQPGAPSIVMGYPNVSPGTFSVATVATGLRSRGQMQEVPDPTVSVGNIGRVLHTQAAAGSADALYNMCGDCYQLTINSAGLGNSGGPVFDDQGQVIGIFNAVVARDVTVSLAVPIRFGLELMGMRRVLR